MFGPNTQNIKSKMAGFSLPGVLVGVALIGISATIISQTVVNSRRTQKGVEIKLTSNQFQQAALDAVTERVKEFVLEDCKGDRWGGAGTSEVEKAFSELPLTTDSGVTTVLKFTKAPDLLTGNDDVKTRCRAPVGPGVLGAGQYMSFCMEVNPTGSPQVDYRLLELLIVPVNLASDQAIQCIDARGAAAGVKVTWQMYNQIDNSKVSGGASGKTVLKESGIFLVSAETQSYSGTCNITAARVGISDQCTINVSGLGLRPPTLKKNDTGVTGFSWTRAPSTNYDAFTATTTCEKTQPSTFKAQSAAGFDSCQAAPVPAVPTYSIIVYNPESRATITGPSAISCGSQCSATFNYGTSVTLNANIPSTPSWMANWEVIWTGCDTAVGRQCTITVNDDRVVDVEFIYPVYVTGNPTTGDWINTTNGHSTATGYTNRSKGINFWLYSANNRLNQRQNLYRCYCVWPGTTDMDHYLTLSNDCESVCPNKRLDGPLGFVSKSSPPGHQLIRYWNGTHRNHFQTYGSGPATLPAGYVDEGGLGYVPK